MHLTNYSINKKNDKFIQNENCEQDDYGYKWSLGAFCRHLEQVGIDMNLLWSRTYDVLIKTILCGENYVQNAMKKNGCHRTNCFEILGFDILIDSDLKPWLLEVNLSPSLACDSPLDLNIKSNLITDSFNVIGVKRFDRKKESLNKIKHRMKGLYNKPGVPPKKQGLGSGIQGTGLSPNSNQDIYG
jgi:tubulin polyglutamylase TTLL5